MVGARDRTSDDTASNGVGGAPVWYEHAMATTTLRATDERTLRTWDGFVLFWVVLWVVVGAWAGVTIWHTADAGDTISSSGRSLVSVGSSLEDLADVPVIGTKPGEIGAEVAGNGQEIIARGQQVRSQLRRLGILLGMAIVGIPVTPVLGVYLPLRLAHRRERERIRREIGRRPDDACFDRYLADRAWANLSYDQIVEIQGRAEPGSGSDRPLADAELTRLGLLRPGRA